MEILESVKIKKLLENSMFSKNIVIRKSLPSTNNTAKELIKNGAPEGTVVLTEEQTAGRGRMDRQWLSPSGKNILISIILKPDISVENIYSLTLAMAVSGVDAVKSITGLSPMIKWPNDIYLNKKKLAGILTEFTVRGKSPVYVILGMGLNVNWDPGKEKNILFPPTSIFNETGKITSRNELIAEILKNFESLYKDITENKLDDFRKRCNRLSILTGKDVSVDAGEEIVKGKVLGIDTGGELILELQNGNVRKILNGDVSIRF